MNPQEDESQRSEELKPPTTTIMTTIMTTITTTITGKQNRNLNCFNSAAILVDGIREGVSILFRNMANRHQGEERGGGAIGIEEAEQLQQLHHCRARHRKNGTIKFPRKLTAEKSFFHEYHF